MSEQSKTPITDAAITALAQQYGMDASRPEAAFAGNLMILARQLETSLADARAALLNLVRLKALRDAIDRGEFAEPVAAQMGYDDYESLVWKAARAILAKSQP